jgi:PAS domain S-box-containing protein
MAPKLTVDELRRTDTVLASVLDDMFDAVYITDKHRHILFWNRGAERVTGYAAADVQGRWCGDNILDHVDENGNYLCKTDCPLVHVFKTGQPIEKKIYPRHRCGKRFPTLTHVAPIHDEAGAIVAVVEVFRDISREEELRLLQEKFHKLIAKYVSTATLEEVMARVQGAVPGAAAIRDLTVLYLDVVGFTAFSELHRPQEAVELLNDIFGMCDVITTECHGDVDKFIGDCIMAVFIDANDAVAAGRKVLEGLGRMNAWRNAAGQDSIWVRIGINSGLVLHGEVGTTHRKDLTVIGDVVNTASRLQHLAPPNGICLSESAYSRLTDAADLLPCGRVRVKGKAEPIEVYHYTASRAHEAPGSAP